MACLGKGFKTGPYLEKTRGYCQWQSSRAKTLTFRSTPTITEDICFKLKRSRKSSKGEYLQHWQAICKVFFYKVIPLFIRPSKKGRIMGSPMAGGVHFFVRSISPKLF